MASSTNMEDISRARFLEASRLQQDKTRGFPRSRSNGDTPSGRNSHFTGFTPTTTMTAESNLPDILKVQKTLHDG